MIDRGPATPLAAPPPGPGRARRRRVARIISERLMQLIPLAALPAGVLPVALLMVSGCPRPAGPVAEPLARLEGLPDIRVLVASGRSLPLAVTGGHRVLADDAVLADSPGPLPQTTLTRKGGNWHLGASVHRAGTLDIQPTGRSLIRIGTAGYRGRMVFHPDGAGGLLAVNHLDVEAYLTGVLGKELFPHWHLRAYQAQAIAARTYALYERATFGAKNLYDLRDDQSSQVYGGSSAETPISRQAVRTTEGIVLATGPEGRERIFRAYYSSCCGGITNNACVLRGKCLKEGPLVGGQICRDCAASTRYRWPAVRISKDAIRRALARSFPAVAALGGVKGIEVASEMHGRPVWVNVVSRRGRKVRVRANDVRLALLRSGQAKGLYSMNCPIRNAGEFVVFGPGRGFGHGVGMCQWGAQGMAQRGCTVQEILQKYYAGAKLFKAYP